MDLHFDMLVILWILMKAGLCWKDLTMGRITDIMGVFRRRFYDVTIVIGRSEYFHVSVV